MNVLSGSSTTKIVTKTVAARARSMARSA
jgi:hypothetical protein